MPPNVLILIHTISGKEFPKDLDVCLAWCVHKMGDYALASRQCNTGSIHNVPNTSMRDNNVFFRSEKVVFSGYSKISPTSSVPMNEILTQVTMVELNCITVVVK